VVPRRGARTPAPAPGLVVLEGFDDPASSTAVRDALRRGRVPRGLLPPAVARYIRGHGLYVPVADPEGSP